MGKAIASDAPARDPDAPETGDFEVTVRCVRSLDQVDRAAWDGLDHGPSPFLEWGFLRALEVSGSVGAAAGWHPHYLLAERRAGGAPVLVGAVAAFVKTHSYGEYIFDWSWASASERAGIPYYPKLVIAAPVTPATGHRLLCARGLGGAARQRVIAALVEAVRELGDDTGCSSIHWLFCTADEQRELERLGFAPRASFQFHWHNPGYQGFDDYLAALTSRKRKQVRKERRRAAEQIDRLDFIDGRELSRAQLDRIDRFYRETTYAHGGMDYLARGFFHRLAELVPDRVVVAEAVRAGSTVAGALFFETDAALYGRYWGCTEDLPMLHFEVAYYAGIERCIARNTPLFEAGAQGEHKLLRGFAPSPTHSSHWIRDPRLGEAVDGFLAAEARAVTARMDGLAEYGPYRRDG